MVSLETKAEAEPLTREELIEKLTRPIYFALDDASLSDQQKEQLKQLASFLLARKMNDLTCALRDIVMTEVLESIILPLVSDARQLFQNN